MVEVVIYTKPFCPYCSRAMGLLKRKGVAYKEILASMSPEKKAEMQARSGRSTYPQIFIDGQHIGGCDDLHELDARGGLDPLLGRS